MVEINEIRELKKWLKYMLTLWNLTGLQKLTVKLTIRKRKTTNEQNIKWKWANLK